MSHEDNRSLNRLWAAFALSSIVFLAVLAISPLKDYLSEYRAFQNEYRDILLQTAGTRRQVTAAESMSVGIRQIWIPELNDTVDRCISCHLGVEEPMLAQAAPPFRFHPATPHTPDDFDRFGCVACHRGQGRATTIADAHGEVEDWETPLLPVAYSEASCGTCHLDEEVPEAGLLSRGRRLMRESGCYGCHELEGHQDWVSPAPPLDGLGQKTTVSWLQEWLKDPAALRPGTRMPNFDLDAEEIEALVAFLRIQPPRDEVRLSGEPLPPGDATRGRTLFREARCISCHLVEGRGNGSASELSLIGDKVNREWLVAYLSDPHAFDPDTPMPRFAFSRDEVLDLSSYLMEEFATYSDTQEEAESQVDLRPSPSLITRGEQLYRGYGCGGCHRLSRLADLPRIGPELNGIGDKPVSMLDFGTRGDLPTEITAWLSAKVTSPRSFRGGLKMPAFDFSAEETAAVVTALLSATRTQGPVDLLKPAKKATYQPPGRFGELVTRYRCLVCHRIQGAGNDIAKADLTFEGSKVSREWIKAYLLTPATIRPLLTDRMLALRMPEAEADLMADFIATVYQSHDIPNDVFEPGGPSAEQVSRGRRLYYERYGCSSCHMIDNEGGYYGPLLNGLGQRLKPGWTAWWLQGPQRWRSDVRCPDYGMPVQDALDLAAFIADVSSATGKEDGSK